MVAIGGAIAQREGGDDQAMASMLASELVGNWSWTVWLLGPLAVVLALVTAVAVGARGEPSRAGRGARGVSRYLAHTTDDPPPPP